MSSTKTKTVGKMELIVEAAVLSSGVFNGSLSVVKICIATHSQTTGTTAIKRGKTPGTAGIFSQNNACNWKVVSPRRE